MEKDEQKYVNIEDFSKIDIRAGTIKECKNLEGSEKLVKLKVDFGDLGIRQILAGIAKWYEVDELTGKQTLFVFNMKPRKMMGEESQGMLLALGLSDDEKPVLIFPSEDVKNGEELR